MRVFAAIAPPAEVLDHIEGAISAVVEPLRQGRQVRISARENWHLTVAFFGEVPDGAIDSLGECLAAVAQDTEPFDISLGGAGVFGNRVLWLGLGEGAEPMRALMRATAAACEDIGFPVDRPERNRAHLTIARSRDGERLGEAAAALAIYRGPTWRADSMRLIRSQPGQGRAGGSRYTEVAAYPFA